MNRLLSIDGHNLLFKAFYGVPEKLLPFDSICLSSYAVTVSRAFRRGIFYGVSGCCECLVLYK